MKIGAIFLQAQIKLQLAWTVTQREVLQSEHAVVQSVCSVTGVPLAGSLYAFGYRSSAAQLNFDLYICIHVHFCKVCSTVCDGTQFTSNITWLRNVKSEILNSRSHSLNVTSPRHSAGWRCHHSSPSYGKYLLLTSQYDAMTCHTLCFMKCDLHSGSGVSTLVPLWHVTASRG